MKYTKVYAREMDGEWGYNYINFKPTGRWKIRTVNNKQDLLVEHKGLLFNTWFLSEDIIIEEIEEVVNVCS